MMEAPRTGYHEIGGVRTYCVRAGQGSPVVLLHGLGATSYSWRRLVPELSKKHAVYAMDIPGFGRSDKPERFDYSFPGFTRWVLEFMDAFGIKNASLVGNSMGGCIALCTALDHPDRVNRLALLGTPTYPDNHPQLIWPLRWPVVGKLFEIALGPWAVNLIAPTAFHDKSCVTPELLAEYGLSLKDPAGRRAVVRFVRGAVPEDPHAWISRYPKLPHPTLVVHGEQDAVVDRPSAERFAKTVPNARLLPISECGHAAQEERPDVVVPALLEFLGNGN